jgi:hypothetical protein
VGSTLTTEMVLERATYAARSLFAETVSTGINFLT